MTLLASSIIDQARGRNAGFDKTRVPDKVALQFLSAYVRGLHGKTARIDASKLRENQDVTLPLADHTAGITLEANRLIAEVTGYDSNDNEFPVDLIQPEHRLDINVRPASAWQVGGTLYLTSPATLWDFIARLVIAYVAIPVALTAPEDTLPVPDTAELACVEQLAAFMARRMPVDRKNPMVDASAFVGVGMAAEKDYLDDLTNGMSGQMILTRDVYRP